VGDTVLRGVPDKGMIPSKLEFKITIITKLVDNVKLTLQSHLTILLDYANLRVNRILWVFSMRDDGFLGTTNSIGRSSHVKKIGPLERV
jgi:hypothetical protein